MSKLQSDEDFITCWKRFENPKKVSDFLKMSLRQVYSRRRNLEAKYGIQLRSSIRKINDENSTLRSAKKADDLAFERSTKYENEMHENLEEGVLLVASDCHYWPGIVSMAHEALCRLSKKISPDIIVLNGDIMDGARISRHPRVMWQKLPTIKEEVYAMQDRCSEIERSSPKSKLIRTIGNHDARFENYLCNQAPEIEDMTGTSLLHYLPRWRAGWSLHINLNTESWTVIRHRHVSGGIHSAYTSTLKAGVHYVHGHLHKLQCVSFGRLS